MYALAVYYEKKLTKIMKTNSKLTPHFFFFWHIPCFLFFFFAPSDYTVLIAKIPTNTVDCHFQSSDVKYHLWDDCLNK